MYTAQYQGRLVVSLSPDSIPHCALGLFGLVTICQIYTAIGRLSHVTFASPASLCLIHFIQVSLEH